MQDAITIKNLSKYYGKIKALDNITLKIGQGRIFGLLGPNGAGKTTLLSILSTLKRQTAGSAVICGFNLKKNSAEMIDDDLTVYDNLDLYAQLYKIKKNVRKQRIANLIRLASLDIVLDKKVETLSGGTKRKVEVIRGLINNPKVLLLDEPTLGLDPLAKKNIWNYLLNINSSQLTTIAVATNSMEEAQFLCHDIGILHEGALIVADKKETLLRKIRKDTIIIEIASDIDTAKKTLKSYDAKVINDKLIIKAIDSEREIQHVVKSLTDRDININRIQLIKPNLEEVFTHYTGAKLK
jgi:ABC-2 type transport system ATP-binding protein